MFLSSITLFSLLSHKFSFFKSHKLFLWKAIRFNWILASSSVSAPTLCKFLREKIAAKACVFSSIICNWVFEELPENYDGSSDRGSIAGIVVFKLCGAEPTIRASQRRAVAYQSWDFAFFFHRWSSKGYRWFSEEVTFAQLLSIFKISSEFLTPHFWIFFWVETCYFVFMITKFWFQ